MPDHDAPPSPPHDLLAEVAHELANPLVIAQGFALNLLRDDDLDAEARQSAEAIHRNVRVALQLLTNYRAAARPGDEPLTLELEWVDVAELVQGTVADLATLSDTHPISVEPPPEPIRILADADRLRQALFNLVSNGVKHTPPGSAIRLRMWLDDDEPDDRIVTIEVADDGEGVAPMVADQIFEPRTRGGGASEGLGLGLFVARRIAEAHGGTLELVPVNERGAVFHLTLPAASPE